MHYKPKLKLGLFLSLKHFALNLYCQISVLFSLSLSSFPLDPKHGLMNVDLFYFKNALDFPEPFKMASHFSYLKYLNLFICLKN